MFDEQTGNHAFDFNDHSQTANSLDIKSIMRQSSTLPTSVATTTITQKFERLIDQGELDRLTNQASLKRQGALELEQLRLRRKALAPYVGSYLTCVLIRLPKICYTIEIDMVVQRVVHWEFQTSQA